MLARVWRRLAGHLPSPGKLGKRFRPGGVGFRRPRSGRRQVGEEGDEEAGVAQGRERAAAAGEIHGDVEAITTLLVAIADSAAPITIAEGGFAGLEAAYAALGRISRS